MKTVLITGASSGFGEATSNFFLDKGWNVIATMREPEKANEALKKSPRALVTQLDVQFPVSIETAIDAGIKRFGRIDVVVNNAGYGLFSIFEGASRESVQAQFDVNVFGVMDVTRAILPHFRMNRAGVLVNVTSGAGAIGFPMASLYSASKFAVEGFSEALWYELASIGIKVKLIEPGGAMKTNFMARVGSEAEKLSTPDDYHPFLGHVSQLYAGMGSVADPDAVEKVVAAIFEASVDGSNRLRYTPTNDIQPLLNARRTTSEEQYESFTRSMFVPQGENPN